MVDLLNALGTLQPWVKRITLIGYASFALFLLFSAAGRRTRLIGLLSLPAKVLFGIAAGLIWCWFILHGYLFLVAAVLGVLIFAVKENAWRSRGLVLAGAAVVIVSLSLAWWLTEYSQPSGVWRALAFAVVAWCVQAGFMQSAETSGRSTRPVLFAFFVLTAVALLSNMTPYQPGTVALGNLLHHQGAYIGPALHVKAGLVPLYDIPLQYGLGPTLSIAAVCGPSGCWAGMALLMVASTVLMGMLILQMALSTRMSRGTAWLATATFVIFAAVVMWPGFAASGSIPASFPSNGGLRFLPVTLVAFLLFFKRYKLAAAALVPAVLWAPEIAVMALVVFGVHETARLGFIKAAVRTIVIVGGSALGLLIVHHAVYGVWIQRDVFVEYIVHVPAAYPINPISDFLFLGAALGLAAWNIFRQPLDAEAFRQDLVVSALLFATSTYYLGRSHPNNICNVMPFIVLVLLRTLDGHVPVSLPGLPRLAILSLSVSAGALMLSHWDYMPFEHGFSLDTSRIATAGARYDTDMVDVRSHIPNPDHLGIADFARGNRSPVETIVWTPMDPFALYGELPSERRQLYIKRSAARLRLPGWVIYGEDQREKVKDFRVAYRVTEERSYKIQSAMSHQLETYVAVHLTPLDEVVRK